MNYPIFLIANKHNGVYRVSAIDFYIDYPYLAPLKPKYFLEQLATIEDNESISTIINGDDSAVLDTILSQYDIN